MVLVPIGEELVWLAVIGGAEIEFVQTAVPAEMTESGPKQGALPR